MTYLLKPCQCQAQSAPGASCFEIGFFLENPISALYQPKPDFCFRDYNNIIYFPLRNNNALPPKPPC